MGKTHRYAKPTESDTLVIVKKWDTFAKKSPHGRAEDIVVVSANRGGNWKLLDGEERVFPFNALNTDARKLRSRVQSDEERFDAFRKTAFPAQREPQTGERGKRAQGVRQGKVRTQPQPHAERPATRKALRAIQRRAETLEAFNVLEEIKINSMLVQRRQGLEDSEPAVCGNKSRAQARKSRSRMTSFNERRERADKEKQAIGRRKMARNEAHTWVYD